MGSWNPTIIGSHRHTFTSGAVTTIAAGTSTAGHILALRSATSGKAVVLKSLEAEFILTTAFSSAQEVGFDAYILRGYSAAHTGATALTLTGGRKITDYPATILTGRIADTGALTAGTHTMDTNAFARGSLYASAIGAQFGPRFYDFTGTREGGITIGYEEGILIRNTIVMGATGVGKWHFTVEWEEVSA